MNGSRPAHERKGCRNLCPCRVVVQCGGRREDAYAFAAANCEHRRKNLVKHLESIAEPVNLPFSANASQGLDFVYTVGAVRIPFAGLMRLAAFMILSIAVAFAQTDASKHLTGITVQGSVRNVAGQLVAGALVKLGRRDGPEVARTTTDAEGKFEFVSVADGTYAVSAEKAGIRSASASLVAASSSSEQGNSVIKVDLALTENGDASSDSAKSNVTASQEMQFADQPNFTIAGVTDWTAAGGHGSDSILRTSEALTRQTLALKPNGEDLNARRSSSPIAYNKETEIQLRLALEKAPQSFIANRNLGAFYLHVGRYSESIPFLEAANKIDSRNGDNEYDLALACKGVGDFTRSRQHIRNLRTYYANADVHRLAGELDEQLGDPLAAVSEFQQAVSKDPSEQNYFEWGSELLLHRAIWQAKEVLTAGANAYPKSARMMTALGAALFAAALYDEAAHRLCDASDLNPSDSETYIFMGKVEMAAPNPQSCIEQKLARYLKQEPGKAQSNYYYAMAVWKQHALNRDQQVLQKVQGLLATSVEIDPHFGEAYLQLGILNASLGKSEPAIVYYSRAIAADPQLIEAHYRLGVAYDRVGQKEKAKQEFLIHDELAIKQAAEVERQRREVKQFVVLVPEKPAAASQN